MNEKRNIVTAVRIYVNGMCIVFDQSGQQIPELQGKFGEKAPLISEALHQQTVNADIYFSEWLGASLGTINLESFDRLWKREHRAIPEVTMQQLIDAGLNAFGLQLFIESIATKEDAKTFNPISFVFRGLRVSFEPEPGKQIDTRHH